MKKYLTSIGLAGLIALGAAGLQTGCEGPILNVPSRVQTEESKGRSRYFVNSEEISENVTASELLSKRDVAREDKETNLNLGNYLTMINDMSGYKTQIESSDKHVVVLFYDSTDVKGQTENNLSNAQALRAIDKLNDIFSDYVNFFAVDTSKIGNQKPAEYNGNGPAIVIYRNNDFNEKPDKNTVFGKEKGSETASLLSLVLPTNKERVPLSKLLEQEARNNQSLPKKTGIEEKSTWEYFNSNGSDYKGIEKSIIGSVEYNLFN